MDMVVHTIGEYLGLNYSYIQLIVVYFWLEGLGCVPICHGETNSPGASVL